MPRIAGRPAWVVVLACAVAAQFAAATVVPLLPEEAYHWNFARHLDWGYYDHPPMLPWSIALGRLVFGDTPLGVRFGPLLFALGTSLLLVRLARCFWGERAALWVVILHMLQPATFIVTGWAFPDSPLFFFWTLTLTFVWQAFATQRPVWWLAAGVSLGAAMLSKYTAAFLVPGALAYVLWSRKERRWLVTPWPYLAGGAALVVFLPVVYWNATHEWVSFRFQSVARFEAADEFNFSAGLKFLAEQWIAVVPLTFPLAGLALWRGFRSPDPQTRFLLSYSVPMMLFFFSLGWTPSSHLLWPLPAYLALTLAMAGLLAEGTGRIVCFYTTHVRSIMGFAVVGLVVASIHALYLLPGAPPLREMYGWDEAAAQAKGLHAGLAEDSFYIGVSGRTYPAPSQLAFHLRQPQNVYGQNLLGVEALQYRYWARPGELAGKDAVVVVEGEDAFGQVAQLLAWTFSSVEPAVRIDMPISRFPFGPRREVHFTFYRAHGYKPPLKEG